MPIPGVDQPETLAIDEELRLRRFDGHADFALSWYQDRELVQAIEGLDTEPYSAAKLGFMYAYLNQRGELYLIELRESGEWTPVGDVTLMPEHLPIVIAPGYHRRGIGRRVVLRLIARARVPGFDAVRIDEIYTHNVASQCLFTSLGFVVEQQTGDGASYVLPLGSDS